MMLDKGLWIRKFRKIGLVSIRIFIALVENNLHDLFSNSYLHRLKTI